MSDEDREARKPRDPDEPFLGRAVDKGILRFTSVTQISMADGHSDEGCFRKWGARYVLGMKLDNTTALTKGADFAEKLEHYLKTGEDVLPKELQPAKKLFPLPDPVKNDLEVEQAFANGPRGLGKDIEKAIAARELLVSIHNPSSITIKPQVEQLKAEIKKHARLVIHDVPVDGAADVRHKRGVFVDEDGKLRGEVPGTRVVETVDLKTMSRIHPQVIRSGENAGEILPSYAKTSAQICHDVQMVTYGVYGLEQNPDSTHQRLSHVIANKTKREAVKRTGLLSNEQVLERFEPIKRVVLRMLDGVGASRLEDFEPNVRACGAYTHVDPNDPTKTNILPGCGYRYVCPLSTEQVHFSIFERSKENTMGLSAFDQLDMPSEAAGSNGVGAFPPPAPTPSLDQAAWAAQVELEKQKFAAAAAAPPPPAPSVPCTACGESLTRDNASFLPDGSVKHFGCKAPIIAAPPPPPPPTSVAPPPPSVTTPPPPPTHEGAVGVKPPDAPVHDWIDQAKPMPAEEIAQVEDPALRAKLELHSKLWHEREAKRLADEAAKNPQQPTDEPWCQPRCPKIVITADIFAAKKFICHCGKSYSVSTLKPIKEGDQHYSVIPKHKPVNKKEAAQPALPATQQPQLPPAPPPPPPSAPQLPPPPPLESGRTSATSPPLANGTPREVVTPPPPPPPPGIVVGSTTYTTMPPPPPVSVTPPPPPPEPGSPMANIEMAANACATVPVGENTAMVEQLFGKAAAPVPPGLLASTVTPEAATQLLVGDITKRIARAIIAALTPIAEGK